jgi:hypothetical protein
MADYAISNVPRRVVYAPSGVGPYAFTFEILSQTDIAVYRASTLLTLTTDYTVTINANGTGSVTLVSTAGTSNITIVGAKNIQRTTDFTTGGDLFANTLNDELDNQTIFIQQVAETAERGLKAPVTDPTDINMTLPSRTSRAGKTLAFDSIGNPVVGEDIGNWRDDWAAGQSYSVRDIVRDAIDNSIYRCNTAHTATGSAPIDTNVDAAKWDLIIDGGAVAEAEAAQAAAEAAQAAAETAETNAETAETNAETAATAAAASQSAAATSATNASNSATAAATSATNASNSATSASTSASTATTQATNASNSATAAATSATNASNSATAASTSASNASTSATAAASSATAASGSASTASTQATNAASSASAASTSATNASNSATAAATSATNASNSATAASTSATNASNSASAASTSASNASTSASNAATSETNAAASASSASTSASTATTQAGAASTSASNAATSASAASTSASNASTSATNASNAQTAAESARDATLAAFDSFDDRYLGSKTSNPTLDNDGNALAAGALYFNSVAGEMRVYTGSAWVAAYVSGAGFLASSNNLSDVANAGTARANLSAVGYTTTTGSAVIPSGTTAQRDGSPLDGYFRYNSELDSFEGYIDGAWGPIGGGGGGGQFFGTAAVKAIAYNSNTIGENLTVTAGNNGYSAGPITISSTFTVTVETGAVWTII